LAELFHDIAKLAALAVKYEISQRHLSQKAIAELYRSYSGLFASVASMDINLTTLGLDLAVMKLEPPRRRQWGRRRPQPGVGTGMGDADEMGRSPGRSSRWVLEGGVREGSERQKGGGGGASNFF
jgi:hypothetical protein